MPDSNQNSHIKQKPQKRKVHHGRVVLVVVIILAVISALAFGGMALWNTFVKPPSSGGVTAPDGMTHKEGIYNILVCGRDRIALNTDTMIIASVDTVKNKINLLSIPRDTMVNVPRKIKKINGAYGKSGKPDAQNMMKEVANITGFQVDGYVMVDLDGFVELIDSIGGVKVNVPQNMNYDDPAQNLSIHLKKGEQTLKGKDAVGFVRFRHDYVDGDLGRVNAQHIFLKALAEKMMNPSQIVNINKYVNFVANNLETDIDTGEMIWLGTKVLKMNPSTDLEMFTLPGDDGYYNHYSYYIINEKKALELINERFNPYDKPIKDLKLIDVSADQLTDKKGNKQK